MSIFTWYVFLPEMSSLHQSRDIGAAVIELEVEERGTVLHAIAVLVEGMISVECLHE
jgi:hypothetical protein